MREKVKAFRWPLLLAGMYLVLSFLRPVLAQRSLETAGAYFKEMFFILPAVFVLMGLMEVWVPKNKVEKWLGRGSGMKGRLLALALGTLPTGPLYVAFPMTATLLEKGAGIGNMVIFLGAWAALKVPQLMVEVQFLGGAFTFMRFVLTSMALFAMGWAMERILGKSNGKERVSQGPNRLDERDLRE